MIHCFLMVQDLFEGGLPHEHVNKYEWMHNVDVYIGDNADYTMNSKCAGGPFMKLTDTNSYTSGAFDSSPANPEDLWNYGAEIWCNLKG